jgi:phosphatidylglycerol---prolipoprotein diacylglyceryl transferase
MIDFTPNPIALLAGPIEIRWYGIGYVAAIVAATWLAFRLARQRGERTDIIIDSLIVMAIAALIGGRAYHVIDQWALYKDDLAKIFLPPYSGLGIYGGLFTGLLAMIWLVRRYKVNFWRWGDIVVPCILVAQSVGRWGNFMNQELYGPPTTLPWGIAIECQNRVKEFNCPAYGGTTPVDAHFIPLFFYESVLSLIGVFVMIFLWRRFTARNRFLVAGDVGLLYFVWYGVERSVLESFRGGWNWTFFGIPMAVLVGMGAAFASIVTIVIRHIYVRRHPASGAPLEVVPIPGTEPPASTDSTDSAAPAKPGIVARLRALLPSGGAKTAAVEAGAEAAKPLESDDPAEADSDKPAQKAKKPKAAKAAEPAAESAEPSSAPD